MRRSGHFLALGFGMSIVGAGALIAQDPGAPVPKAPPTAYRRVPSHFGQLGLTPQQKEAIYAIRGQYADHIAELKRQIGVLQQQEMAECEGGSERRPAGDAGPAPGHVGPPGGPRRDAARPRAEGQRPPRPRPGEIDGSPLPTVAFLKGEVRSDRGPAPGAGGRAGAGASLPSAPGRRWPRRGGVRAAAEPSAQSPVSPPTAYSDRPARRAHPGPAGP